MREKFKSIIGYEGLYSVSNCGRIRSDRNTSNTFKGKMLMDRLTQNGYCLVNLFIGHGKKGRNKRIHCLVAEAFIGPRPLRHDVNHKDGNKRNNRLTNLEYITRSENMLHAVKNGCHKIGSQHGAAKMDEEGVLRMRQLKVNGVKIHELSYIFEISLSTVYKIINRKIWKHI